MTTNWERERQIISEFLRIAYKNKMDIKQITKLLNSCEYKDHIYKSYEKKHSEGKGLNPFEWDLYKNIKQSRQRREKKVF